MHLQASAQEILGLKPVTFPSCYYNEVKRTKQQDGEKIVTTERQWLTCSADKGGDQLFEWETLFYWSWILGFIQLYVDAFTFDAQELAHKNSGVIKARGKPQPPWSNKVTDASVGSLPKFLVLMAVHWLLGVFVYFPFTSRSGGRKKSFCEFQCWFTGLPAAYLTHMQGFGYYNHPEAVAKLVREKPTVFTEGAFNPSLFKVCPYHRFIFFLNCSRHFSRGIGLP